MLNSSAFSIMNRKHKTIFNKCTKNCNKNDFKSMLGEVGREDERKETQEGPQPSSASVTVRPCTSGTLLRSVLFLRSLLSSALCFHFLPQRCSLGELLLHHLGSGSLEQTLCLCRSTALALGAFTLNFLLSTSTSFFMSFPCQAKFTLLSAKDSTMRARVMPLTQAVYYLISTYVIVLQFLI